MRPAKKLSKKDKAIEALRMQRLGKANKPSALHCDHCTLTPRLPLAAKARDKHARRVINSDSDADADPKGKRKKQFRPKYVGASSSSDGSGGTVSSSSGGSESSDLEDDLEDFLADEDDDNEEAERELQELKEAHQSKKQGVFFHVKPFLQWLVHVAFMPEGQSTLSCLHVTLEADHRSVIQSTG